MKSISRIYLLFLILLLVISAIPATTAKAADFGEADTYVLHYGVADDDYTGPNIQYFSPYVTDYIYDGTATYIQNNIFSLYNTVTKEVVPAYCTDIKVGAAVNNVYRRLNLEDSTYAASAAGRLRAVVRNGFYLVPIAGESMDAHKVRVQAKLAELGAAAGVEGLTIGEAISGTQSAIWQLSHGSLLEYTDFVRTIYTTKMPSASKYYEICNEERENGHIDYTVSAYGKVTLDEACDALLNTRIRAVYDYLLSLSPVSASSKTVSPASFTKLNSPVVTQNADGTYRVAVTTTVDVDMAAGDTLTLKAAINSTYYQSTALVDGMQTVTLTIDNVPAELSTESVTLSISGKQSVFDVFLYDAYGGREVSQSMIGMDSSQLPVYAQVSADPNRVLNFIKTTSSRHPLEGITFDIHFIATLSDYLSGDFDLPDATDCPYPALADYSVTTDAKGNATLDFTQHGLVDGIYLVVERNHPAIKAPIDPFYVFIPATNASGTGYDYEITVHPKNEVKGSVRIEKDVTSIGNDSSTVNAYSNHTWIIGSSIPEDIANGKSYTISDTLDNRLDYIGNIQVKVESVDGETVVATLQPDIDYTLTVSDVDSLAGDKPSDSLMLELTDIGMGTVAASIGKNAFEDYMLRVYFEAQINANAEVATEIPNKALLEYTNSVNFTFNKESDRPVVYTGAANLLKVSAENTQHALPGATFEVYRSATDKEIAAGGDELVRLDDRRGSFVKVSFFDNAQMHGEKVTSVTSDESGKIAIYGLAYGKYYLVETQAPLGYNLLGSTMEITIDKDSHKEEYVVVVENIGGTVMPETGGIGTTVYTIAGITLIFLSTVLFLKRKRMAC